MIAALNQKLLFAPFVFEGYSNRETYTLYVEKVLAPALRPGMVVVIDNASFHKSRKISELIEARGCRVLFLPTYSPDLNQIEHSWSSLKRSIRSENQKSHNMWDAVVTVLKQREFDEIIGCKKDPID
jgi:transposase